MITTETHAETTRRLQLLGIPADVIPGLISYVEQLNAKQLEKAVHQYSHLLRDDFFTDDVRHEDRLAVAQQRGATVTDLKEFFDIDPNATGAGKYVQVVSMRPDYRDATKIVPDSVHSVVVKATGQVAESAGWKQGPAKSTAKATKGQILSRYTLTDSESLSALLTACDTYGSYLYTR